MTAKSILEIDVADGAFKDFQARFDKYREDVAKQPAAWGAIGKGVKESAKSAGIFHDALNKVLDTNEKNRREVEKSHRGWIALEKSTGKAAKNIAGMTASLLKWASLTGVFSGILGGGGLFGIERMAQSASASRRQSQGFGVSPGALSAARINFGSAVDVDSALGNIRDAQNDVSKRWAFNAMGVDANQSPDKLLGQMIKSAKNIQEHDGGTIQGAQAHGLNNFFSMEDLTRFKALSNAEIDAMVASTAADKKNLEMSDQTNKLWQDFNKQLSRSSIQIENTFINGLAPLAGPLAHLSKSVTDCISAFLASPQLKEWIKGLSVEIDKFAKYLGTPEFKKDVDSFTAAVKQLAQETVSALRFFHLIPRDPVDQNKPLTPSNKPNPLTGETAKKGEWDANQNPLENFRRLAWFGMGRHDVSGKIAYPESAPSGLFSSLERQYGLPAGLQDAQWLQESVRGQRMLSPAGAKGHFGFMDDTAKQYGVNDPNDLTQSAIGNAKMMADLMKHYKGVLKNALAAYNWGIGNEDHFLAGDMGYTNSKGRYVDTSRQPRETQNYVITVMNNTGGSAITTARAVAQ